MTTDEPDVGFRIVAAVPRLLVVGAALLFASATLTLAAGTTMRAKPPRHNQAAPARHVLVVPDVRRQVFVFAKGMLEDAGLGWRVHGGTHGYPSNIVVSQSPEPGTRVIDTGAPAITLELGRNGKYAESGEPQDVSPYGASKIRLVPKHVAKPVGATAKQKAAPHQAGRQPAFVVPGAPVEPLHELSLPARAHRLSAWLGPDRRATEPNVRYWIAENAWIVNGARVGWYGGASALKTLIAVDRRAEHTWKVGSATRKNAQQALRYVQARSR